ncbi:MAG: hypothetical protein MUF76_14630, partial [Hydrogenophaga sp.]|nr:hypothetical protein [Hydrogenophaga sp.]
MNPFNTPATDGPTSKPLHRRWWPWALGVLALLTLLGTLWFAWLVRYPWHLESFDHAKAAQLTPEKRAAYEQELFS